MVHHTSHQPELVTLGRLTLAGSDFERTKPLLLLCYLCLEGPQERRHLAELFWPRAANALASLSTELSRLKKHLGEVFEADDVRVYPRLRSDARVLLDAAERKEYGRAAALYAGDFLPEVSAQEVSAELREWIEHTRTFLAARACEARLTLGERAAKSGDFAGAAQHAAEASEPLMLASNTKQLRRAYTLLVAGEHPRAAQLRQHADALGLPELTLEAARRRLRPNQRTLPTYTTSFVGRSSEVCTVMDLLRGEARLVTVVGLAGMGKSRLAVEVIRGQAELFTDIYPVWLVALTKEDEVLSALAGALGLELGEQDILEQVAQHLASKRCLLYFDNFEHVIGAAPLLSELLTRCPNLKVLVTSRERLNLEEEWVVWLEGLPGADGSADGLSEAAQLFVQRARRTDLTFSPTEEDARAIEAICRRVEGSPLALELAASWTRLMPCADIAAQLSDSQEVLKTSLRNVPERHRSIEAAFEYSWRLLSDEERRVLRELSVFRGGFSREAAKEVVGASLPTLVSLVDKSLLVLRDGGRFGRHPLLYEFTRRKLAERGDAQTLKRQHAAYYRRLLERYTSHFGTQDTQDILHLIEQELSNVMLAWSYWLEHAQGDAVAAALSTLWQYFDFSSKSQEGVALFASASDHFAALGTHAKLRVTLLRHQAQLLYRLSQFERALRVAKESLALARDDAEQSTTLSVLGTIYRVLHRADEARGAYQRALCLLDITDTSLKAKVLTNLASLEAAPNVGNLEGAARLYEESLALKRALGDDVATARTLYNYASLAQQRGKLEIAVHTVRECLSKCVSVGYKPLISYAENLLGKLLLHQGAREEGCAYLLQALRGARDANNTYLTSIVLVNLALPTATTRAEDAVKLLGAAHVLRNSLNLSPLEEDEDYQRVVDAVHASLSATEFTSILYKGKQLTLEEAVSLLKKL